MHFAITIVSTYDRLLLSDPPTTHQKDQNHSNHSSIKLHHLHHIFTSASADRRSKRNDHSVPHDPLACICSASTTPSHSHIHIYIAVARYAAVVGCFFRADFISLMPISLFFSILTFLYCLCYTSFDLLELFLIRLLLSSTFFILRSEYLSLFTLIPVYYPFDFTLRCHTYILTCRSFFVIHIFPCSPQR